MCQERPFVQEEVNGAAVLEQSPGLHNLPRAPSLPFLMTFWQARLISLQFNLFLASCSAAHFVQCLGRSSGLLRRDGK